MTLPDGSAWSLRYDDERSSARILASFPPGMLRDLRILARAKDMSLSELIRQACSREVAEFLEARPEVRASFRGMTPDAHASRVAEKPAEPGGSAG